jgi:hypothetical protein
MPSKLPQIGWGRWKYTKLKNLTAYFGLKKALLANKIHFKEENSKFDV